MDRDYGRERAPLQRVGGGQRTPHGNFACHSSQGSPVRSSWEGVCPTGLLRLCCVASLYPSGGVGAGRNAHQSSSFSCVTTPRILACRCVASSLFLRLNVTRGRLKSIAVKVSKPKRAFFSIIEKRCVSQASEPLSGWVRIRYTCREWLFRTSLQRSPWMPTLSMRTFLC